MVESGNPKAIGWLSSIVAIILALLLLHTFPLMGNWIDTQRAGDGKYQFDGKICYDTNVETDFNNNYKVGGSTGKGAMLYNYYDGATPKSENNKINMQSIPLNGTVDKFSVGVTNPNPGDVPVADPVRPNTIFYQMNFTKKKILDLDVVYIDIYFDIAGVTFSTVEFHLRDEPDTTRIFDSTTIKLGNVTRIKVKVTDLLKINILEDGKKIHLSFASQNNELIPANTFVVFDMQFYCIEEIKAPTLTRLAGWMSLMNIGILILVFISFPQVQVLGRFNNIGERLKKI